MGAQLIVHLSVSNFSRLIARGRSSSSFKERYAHSSAAQIEPVELPDMMEQRIGHVMSDYVSASFKPPSSGPMYVTCVLSTFVGRVSAGYDNCGEFYKDSHPKQCELTHTQMKQGFCDVQPRRENLHSSTLRPRTHKDLCNAVGVLAVDIVLLSCCDRNLTGKWKLLYQQVTFVCFLCLAPDTECLVVYNLVSLGLVLRNATSGLSLLRRAIPVHHLAGLPYSQFERFVVSSLYFLHAVLGRRLITFSAS